MTPGHFSGDLSFQNTHQCAASPDFQASACHVIISFSSRDIFWKVRGCIVFPPKKGNFSGGFKENVEEEGLVGSWSSGCGGPGCLHPDDCPPLVFDGPVWMGKGFLPPPPPGPGLSQGPKASAGNMPASPNPCSLHISVSFHLSQMCTPGPMSDDAIVLDCKFHN